MSEQHLGGVATVARSTLLKRAAIAGGLIVVLLVALGWFERSQAPAPEPAPVLAEAPPPPTDALPAGAPPMPSAADVEAMRQALAATARGSEIVVYPEAGHAFFADYRPSYRAPDAADGWQRMQRWFVAHGL